MCPVVRAKSWTCFKLKSTAVDSPEFYVKSPITHRTDKKTKANVCLKVATFMSHFYHLTFIS